LVGDGNKLKLGKTLEVALTFQMENVLKRNYLKIVAG
jgi:hypothetical protein